MEQEKKGAFTVSRFEEKTERSLNWWYDAVLRYIAEKRMIETPECSYAWFVREKFPEIWEKYVRLASTK